MQDSKHGVDRRSVISAAWIFVTLNYLFANIFKLPGGVVPTTAEEVESVSSMATPEMLLFAAIYLELAMVMIVLSRLLKYGLDRWANIIIATLHALGATASLSVVTLKESRLRSCNFCVSQFFAPLRLRESCLFFADSRA